MLSLFCLCSFQFSLTHKSQAKGPGVVTRGLCVGSLKGMNLQQCDDKMSDLPTRSCCVPSQSLVKKQLAIAAMVNLNSELWFLFCSTSISF